MSFLLAHTAFLGRSAARPAAAAAAATTSASSLSRRGVKTADDGKQQTTTEGSRPKGYDEQGASADAVAETDAAFEPGTGPKEAAHKVEQESGQGMQDSPASRTASDPSGKAAEPKK